MTHQVIDLGVWSLLAQKAPRLQEYAVVPSGILTGVGEVLIGLDSQGCRHVLIPVARGSQIVEDRQSEGIEIVAHRLVELGIENLFVDVACRKPHLHEIFSIVANEILVELAGASGAPDAVARSVLEHWRELLRKARAGHLGIEALLGLYGELTILLRLVQLSASAIDSWVGPAGNRHDFRRGDVSLEVKTTASSRGRMARINGVLQLEPPDGGVLFLAFLRVEQVNDAGRSVPDLVDEIGRVSSRRSSLLDKLARLGYDPLESEQYRSTRFSVLEERLYHVDAEFPAITRGSFTKGHVPPGVLELEYTIDLASEPPRPQTRDEVASILAGIAGSRP